MKRLGLLLFVLVTIISCTKKEDPVLTVDRTTIETGNINVNEPLVISSNIDWQITSSDSWCKVSNVTGSGNKSIAITCDDNHGDNTRTATLNITGSGLKKSVYVTQASSYLYLDKNSILYEKEGGTQSFRISTNTNWSLAISANSNWITTNKSSGTGTTEINVISAVNVSGPERIATITITYGTSSKLFNITQKRASNSLPTKPTLSFPASSATNIDRMPLFQWTKSTDSDGDAVSYILKYSLNQTQWTEVSTTSNFANPSANLNQNTTYYWKVTALDSYGGSIDSDIYSFTTSNGVGYTDGSFKVYQTNTVGIAPCEVIFVGDGYIAADFADGALFDQDANAGIEAFFNIEPYKSYRSHFKIYKLAAFSAESGVTQTDKNIVKNTCFSTQFKGGSSMSTDNLKVFEYAKKVTGITDEKLKNVLVVLIVNQNRYAGTCWMWSDGKAIAICPVSKSTNVGMNYVDLVHHEAGGHGWAGLADEYINNSGKTITAEDKASYQSWANLGFNANVDVTNDLATIKWKSFVGKSGYERVGAYEGAIYYSYGAWRAESTSCMINNIPYFSAPSREAAVKKIMRVSGGTYNLDNFVASDIQKAPTAAVLSMTKSYNPLTFVPLAPPVRINVR